jgi:glutamine---fructose-6-phosphate transaminase (isomerizing)
MSVTAREIASQPAMWDQAAGVADAARPFFGPAGERVLFLGCGTSEFVAHSVARLREAAGLGESDADFASEWRPGRRYDRIVSISRSGTTTEIVDAIDRARRSASTARQVAVTAVREQPIEAVVDDTLVLDFADESSVVQTRFPTTVLVLARRVFGEDTSGLAAAARELLAGPADIDVRRFDHFVHLGTDWTLGVAHEAALKIREAAQAWSESYPLLDYRHGPIAVAGERTLVRIFGPAADDLVDDIRGTGATVVHDDLDPLLQLVQAQRVAVALAESRGLDPDTPRHLTRSVILG